LLGFPVAHAENVPQARTFRVWPDSQAGAADLEASAEN